MKTFFSSILFIALFILTSCNKEDEPECIVSSLPKVSLNGAHTMGCLWDNEPWSPYLRPPDINGSGWQPITTDFYHKDRALDVYAYKEINDVCSTINDRMFVRVRYDDTDTVHSFFIKASRGDNRFLVDSTQVFNIKIHRFDRVARVFSAEFNGTLTDDLDPSYSIKIDSFRMDVRF